MRTAKLSARNIATTLSVIVIFVISATMAYFTSADTVTNRFTVGNIKIQLLETKYDQNENAIENIHSEIIPAVPIEKDPKIKNVGKNPAYVFIKVCIPYETVRIINDKDINKALHIGKSDKVNLITDAPLYCFSANLADDNEGWVEITTGSDSYYKKTEKYYEHLFAYCVSTSGGLKALQVNDSTGTLMDNVTFCNYYPWQESEKLELKEYEAELAKLTDEDAINAYKEHDPRNEYGADLEIVSDFSIPIEGYALQSDELSNELKQKSLKELWEYFFNEG